MFVFGGDAASSTLSNDQFLETFIQRFLLLVPGQAAYTAAIVHPKIYKTKAYTAITTVFSLSLLALVIGLPEYKRFQDKTMRKRIQEQYAEKSGLPDDLKQTLDQVGALPDEIDRIITAIQTVKQDHLTGHSTNRQLTNLQGALQDLIARIFDVTGVRKPDSTSNPHKARKLKFVGLAAVMVGVQLSAVAKTPVLLVEYIRWGAFFLYILIKSALNPAHETRDTAQLFCSVGTGAIMVFPLVTAPLRIRGEGVFGNTTYLAVSVVLTCLLNITLPHHIAPAGLWLLDRIANMTTCSRRLLDDEDPADIPMVSLPFIPVGDIKVLPRDPSPESEIQVVPRTPPPGSFTSRTSAVDASRLNKTIYMRPNAAAGADVAGLPGLQSESAATTEDEEYVKLWGDVSRYLGDGSKEDEYFTKYLEGLYAEVAHGN